AVKQSEDGQALIVRFYNASAAPSRATVRFTLPRPVTAVRLADMKETPGAAVRRSDQSAEVPVGPWSSVTLRVSF
ncbi:MAG: glycosyl hydrolase-related protein, partial [Chloroflexi bacterium]|nr:glycosyl hydrolase-related protein [Chloroflexota bacterium]